MLRISVHSSRQLQAIILAMKQLDKEVRKQIRQQTRQVVRPEWERALAEHASTRLEHRVLVQTARAQVSDQNVQLQSARVGRSLSGGLKPSVHFAPVEFGANRNEFRPISTKATRTATQTMRLKKRRTMRQFRPAKRQGYVVYPAAANIIPRIAALWAQTVARTTHEAFESR